MQNDLVEAGREDDIVLGLGGHDRLYGQHGADFLYGQDGNDRIEGGIGADTLFGGTGDDTVFGNESPDQLIGGSGHDHLLGGQGNDVLRGNIGDDILRGNEGDDTLHGDDGSDLLHGSTGADRLIGGEGSDAYRIDQGQGIEVIIDRGGGLDQIVFGAGITFDDLDVRTAGRDVVITHASRLTVQILNQTTWQGIEYLRFEEDSAAFSWNGGAFVEAVNPPPSPPPVSPPVSPPPPPPAEPTQAADRLLGTPGNDIIDGLGGDDEIRGGGGNDRLYGSAGDDRLYGEAGDDYLEGGGGHNHLDGGEGNDTIEAGAVWDEENIPEARATVFGGNGDDILRGGYGDDTLVGGAGADTLSGGNGADTLTGGDGGDLFLYDFFSDYQIPDDGNPDYQRDEANDIITDFVRGQDRLEITLTMFNADPSLDIDTEVKFSDLDTDGDGALTRADEVFDTTMATYGGDTRLSLTIDAGKLTPPEFGMSSLNGTITLLGVTILTAEDLA